jgi:hypothetical protein
VRNSKRTQQNAETKSNPSARKRLEAKTGNENIQEENQEDRGPAVSSEPENYELEQLRPKPKIVSQV